MKIQLSNVYKQFDKTPVIRDLTLSVASGETVCLLGPSGSGKTTVIRLLIGAIAADRGEITIGGERIPNRKLLRKIGFMPQNDALYDDLSGEDNLKFFAELFGMKKGASAAKIDEALALMDLTGDRKKFVRHYSGGMKKRLSLAAALIHEPDILLLDEPTVGIDPVLRRAVWNELHKLEANGKTILVSTHVMDEVAECAYAALIYNGRLIEYDRVEHLLGKTKSGKLEELFFAVAEAKGDAKI
jgi:ABC-2 type transport system ATP-binding protein